MADEVQVVWQPKQCPRCHGRMSVYHFNPVTNFLGITQKKFKCNVCGFEQPIKKLVEEYERKQNKKRRPKRKHRHKKRKE